jgi:hypothetical protein
MSLAIFSPTSPSGYPSASGKTPEGHNLLVWHSREGLYRLILEKSEGSGILRRTQLFFGRWDAAISLASEFAE